MVGLWTGAFVAAGLVSLLVTPLMQRLAPVTGFLDRPAARKSHTRPTPYLGGVAIMAATLGALVWQGAMVGRIGVVALAAAGLGLVGLVDDRRTVSPRLRLLVQVLAAVAVVSVGIRVHATGVVAIDVGLTILWVVGVTNALNLLDNMDGLAGGVSVVTAAGVLALAALAGQHVVTALAAGLAGACVGFLAYNVRPAAIFMGDAGSLFLGFLLSVAVLEVDPALGQPASFLVPLVLLALPVLDTTTVTLARLRNGRKVSDGGKDHLSHRLVKRGLSPGLAVGVLVGAQALLVGLAVLAGRQLLPLPVPLVGAAAVLAAITAVTVRVRVYESLPPAPSASPEGDKLEVSLPAGNAEQVGQEQLVMERANR
jgi:UDP-GlcNAc:undecaprenyl-phosphate GlcNAc-1-phosphate transferase